MGEVQLIGPVVFIRPAQPKGRDGAHHQAGIHLLKRRVGDAEFRHSRWGIIVNEYIGLGDQGAETFGILADITGHTALIGIQI